MHEYDVVVIGGGLAGLSAAAEAAQWGLRCVAFTGPAPGGLLLSIDAVQGMPGHPDGIPGYDLCPMTQEEGMDAGAEFVAEEASPPRRDGDGWRVEGGGRGVRAQAVVLAPGSRLRALGVPGEAAFEGRGVSHCANCDGPLLRGRTVAVVGGGDAACQEALALAAHVGRVLMLVRGDALRARETWQERVRAEPKIELHLRTQVAAIEGGTAVEALRLADGRTLAVDGVFVYAGLVPQTETLQGLVALDADGRILTDADLACAGAPGLFAAGSARAGHDGQAASAAAEGRAAAQAVQRFLGR